MVKIKNKIQAGMKLFYKPNFFVVTHLLSHKFKRPPCSYLLVAIFQEMVFSPKSTVKFLFSIWAIGCTASLATSKVPDARRQGVTTESVSAILRREERPQATQQAGTWWWIRVSVFCLTYFANQLFYLMFRAGHRFTILLPIIYFIFRANI